MSKPTALVRRLAERANDARNANARKTKQKLIVPNGQASKMDRCSVCGRLPEAWEEPFMIYRKPICEDCFWGQE